MAFADFDALVAEYYEPLYRFAYSLTRTEADAEDLAQQTFYVWATKGHQLRDATKVKSWLFTTLHRSFLEGRRRQVRFPHYELTDNNIELPSISPEMVNRLDCVEVLKALAQVDAAFQSAIALFYLEDFSYKEIADVLQIPIGTVKSRMARGLVQLRQILETVPRERREQDDDDDSE